MNRTAAVACLIVGFALAAVPSIAQPPPDTMWTQTLGGPSHEYCYHIRQTVDGGYIIAGSKHFDDPYGRQLCLIKTDSEGNVLWNQCFGVAEHDADGHCAQLTDDGGYIIVGSVYENLDGLPFGLVIKTDSEGIVLWSQVWGEYFVSHYDFYWVEQSSDGGYIITGNSGINYKAGLWKLDSEGNLLWSHIYEYPISSGECV